MASQSSNKSQPETFGVGSSEPSSESLDSTELPKKIRLLEAELIRLRKEHYLKQGTVTQDLPDIRLDKYVELDLELQRQILQLTEAMPHMVWIADAEGKTIHANNRFYEFTGIGHHLDDGWAWVNVLHPDDLQAALEAGNEAALVNKSFSMELRCKSGKGDYQWHLMHSIPFYDPDSGSTKWFGTTTNIHEQKKAQEMLARSEAQLSTLADAIPHIVFAAHPDGKVYFWNHRFFEYSGLTAEQSMSQGWELLIHAQDRAKYLSEWETALKSGDTFEIEFRLKRAVGVNQITVSNQGYLWHLARAVSMRDNEGRIIRWFGTWTEIEGQKRNRE